MRKSGLTNATQQRLTRLVDSKLRPKKAWSPYEEREGVDLEDTFDIEIDTDVSEAELTEDDLDMSKAMDKMMEAMDAEEYIPATSIEDDPMVEIQQEPWDEDWQITAKALNLNTKK